MATRNAADAWTEFLTSGGMTPSKSWNQVATGQYYDPMDDAMRGIDLGILGSPEAAQNFIGQRYQRAFEDPFHFGHRVDNPNPTPAPAPAPEQAPAPAPAQAPAPAPQQPAAPVVDPSPIGDLSGMGDTSAVTKPTTTKNPQDTSTVQPASLQGLNMVAGAGNGPAGDVTSEVPDPRIGSVGRNKLTSVAALSGQVY